MLTVEGGSAVEVRTKCSIHAEVHQRFESPRILVVQYVLDGYVPAPVRPSAYAGPFERDVLRRVVTDVVEELG